jgi:RHS repeat-associated protein
MDAASNVTSYTCDSAGRRIQVIDALANTIHTAYDLEGRVLVTWGATYPVAYDYDDFGRMIAMYTLRDPSLVISNYSSFITHTSSLDRTRWLYDETTGLLTNKVYADGHGPSYTYTPDGKLATRTWARGIVTTYSYDSLGQLTNISYSDGTPSVTFTFDRLGRQTTITDGAGTRAFTYNDALQLQSETNTQGVLQYVFDSQARPAGYDLSSGGTTSVSSVRYGYDEMGRFLRVDADVPAASLSRQTFQYAYLPGSDLIQSVLETNTGFSLTRAYEPNRNLITSITNSFGGTQLHRFDCTNDEIGRRTKRTDYDLSVVLSNLFAYNVRSELEEASMGTNSYSYRYDPIGNRRTATNNAEALAYAANALNQYSQISNQTSQVSPVFDLDGNMTGYKDWTFIWDAENRLVLASNATTVVSNSYDYMSRRVAKVVNGQAIVFTYQGWAMIREVSGTTSNSYVYGLDLSGTAQGAGTIGGILSASFGGTTSVSSAFYCYDANGNVTDLVGTNGEFLAQYQYDPYGNTISKSGALADVNPFRFSTKYLDAETGLYYYGYRFYNPEIGRWASRDPSSEKGGLNLYGTVWNSPIRYADPLGLAPQLCGIDSNGMPIYCDDPPPCHGHCPPPTDPGAECLDVPGLPADSSECDLYGDRRYLGTSLKCFCKCAGDSDWSKKVRGCLRCMDKKGVDPFEAHIRCYQTASNAGYDRPNIRIGCCYVSCLRGGR